MPYRLFLPKKKKRSSILSIQSLIYVNIFLLLILFAKEYTMPSGYKILGFATNIGVEDLLSNTNLKRSENGLPPLTLNSKLSSSAYQKALNMFDEDYWAHVSPSGKTPWSFIRSSGYEYVYAGENLAKDFNNSRSVVNAWMDSPSHRENLLNSHYTEIGFAVVNGKLQGRETTLVVQMFGSPQYISKVDGTFDNPNTSLENETTELEPNLAETPAVESEILVTEPDTELPASNNISDLYILSIPKNYMHVAIYGIFVFFAFALLVDSFVAYKNHHLRITGNTLAHLLLFLGSLSLIYYLNFPSVI